MLFVFRVSCVSTIVRYWKQVRCITPAWIPPCEYSQAPTTSIEGKHVCTLSIRTEKSNGGLAISPDSTRLVVSNVSTHKIAVYSLIDGPGAFLSEVGGEGTIAGKFNSPRNICFSPRISSSMFIADSGNKRVQV